MSNHIDHIEITNFKSICHAKIEGCKRINVFIGYPNVGKSNILEALSLFSLPYLKIAGSKKLTDFIRVKNLPGLFYGTNTSSPIEISINDVELQFIGNYDKSAFYPLECDYYYSKYNSDNNPKGLDASEFPFFENLLNSDKKPQIFFDDNLNVKFENLPKKIGGFGNLEILKYHFSVEKFKPKNTVFPVLIPPYGNNLFEVINQHKELREFLQHEFAKVEGEYIYHTEDNTGRILKGNNGNRFTLPISSMADTLQRLIFYMAAVTSNQNSVLIFEEPESHMFPPYISILVNDIIADENNNQYFIATHSPFVLNDLMENLKNEELSIFAVGSHKGETTIHRISDEEMHEIYQYGIDLFFNLEDYLRDV